MRFVSIFVFSVALYAFPKHSTSECNSGAYIFDNACYQQSQGIGSSINKMKIQILVSQVFNLSLLPNPACFYSHEHSTNMLTPFGWDYNIDCDVNAIERARNMTTSPSLPIIVPINILEGSFDQKESSLMCNALYEGTLASTLPKIVDDKKNGIFAQLSATINRTDPSNRRRTIYSIQRPYHSYNIEGYQCSGDLIASRFYEARQRQIKSHPEERRISFDRSKINIAFHFRYGDTAKADPTYPKEPNWDVGNYNINWIIIDNKFYGQSDYSEQHRLPLKTGIALLQMLLGEKSALVREQTAIHFFSEGDPKLFHKFKVAFPSTVFHLGNQSTTLLDLDHMAAAGLATFF